MRALGDIDSSPPCMADAFRCMGKAAHVALCVIARHLRLHSDYDSCSSVIFGIKNRNVSQRSGFLSGLALYFPFVFSLFKRDNPESKYPLSAHPTGNPCSSEDMHSLDSGDKEKLVSSNLNNRNVDLCSEELQKLLESRREEINDLRQHNGEDGGTEAEMLSSSNKLVSGAYDQTSEGEHALEREALIFWNVGPASHTARMGQRTGCNFWIYPYGG